MRSPSVYSLADGNAGAPGRCGLDDVLFLRLSALGQVDSGHNPQGSQIPLADRAGRVLDRLWSQEMRESGGS